MRIASLVTIFLLGLSPGYAAADLNGVWTLNRAKSDFGKVIAPAQVVVRMEQTGRRLATWRVTSDLHGQHLVYREYTLAAKRRSLAVVANWKPVTIVLPMESTGVVRTFERWQVSKAGRLIIRRSIATGPRIVHQRLVLEPSTDVQATNQVP
jgi:hypothetical protein